MVFCEWSSFQEMFLLESSEAQCGVSFRLSLALGLD